MKTIPINNFNEKMYYEKLPNGLEVYLVPMKNKKNYHCLLGTRYGGRNLNFKVDEKEYQTPSGIAHFLEHKLFDNSENNPFEFYLKSGTDVNASTTSDYTAYYFLGNNAFIDNLRFLLNWITNFDIDEEKVKKEQGIILEEANMYKDKPDRILYENILKNTFLFDTRRQKVIGTDKDITSITKEDLELCYKSFYRPDNMYLIAVGSFDEKEVIKVIKEELKDFKNDNTKVVTIEKKEPDKVYKDYEELYMDVETPKVAISYKINKNKFKNIKLDKYFLDYYLQVILTLGFGSASDFREELLNKNLFSSFSSQVFDANNHYIINFFITSNYPNEVIKRIDEYIKCIKFNEEDFARLKKNFIASEIRMIDSINATIYNILDDILDYKEFKGQKINDIKSLDFKTLNKVYSNVDFKNRAVLVILNKK